jgi:hypothetical protein
MEQAEVATTTAKANVARTDRERRVANTTGSVSGREWERVPGNQEPLASKSKEG